MDYRYLGMAITGWFTISATAIIAFFLSRIFIKCKKERLVHRRLDQLKIQYIVGSINREQYDSMTKEAMQIA